MTGQAILLLRQAQEGDRDIRPEHFEKTLLHSLRRGRLPYHRREPVQLADRSARLPIPEQLPGETMTKLEHLSRLFARGDSLTVGGDPARAIGTEGLFLGRGVRSRLPRVAQAIETQGHALRAGRGNSGRRRRATRKHDSRDDPSCLGGCFHDAFILYCKSILPSAEAGGQPIILHLLLSVERSGFYPGPGRPCRRAIQAAAWF